MKIPVHVLHKQGANWEVRTEKTLRGMIHTWMPEQQKMLLLKEVTLSDRDNVMVFSGEFLSYLNQYGMLVPVMRG